MNEEITEKRAVVGHSFSFLFLEGSIEEQKKGDHAFWGTRLVDMVLVMSMLHHPTGGPERTGVAVIKFQLPGGRLLVSART